MLGLQFCALTGLVILTVNLLKYLRVLKIEGEIALLSLYCNNCYTAHHRRTHRKRDLYALCAFYEPILVSRNLILRNYMKCYVKNVYIFHFFGVLCFSENTENARNDDIKITKTEKKTKIIELHNYKFGSYNSL